MKLSFKLLFLLLLAFWGNGIFANTAQITKFHFTVQPDKIRLVFTINMPISYKVNSTTNQVIIKIKKAKLAMPLNKNILVFAKTRLSSITTTRAKEELNLILNLKSPVKLKHFLLKQPERLVLDLYSLPKRVENKSFSASKIDQLPAGTMVTDQIEVLEQSLVKELNQPISKAPAVNKKSKLRDIIVVIDPGHGGYDPGAIGAHGTEEKQLTLMVAKKLQNILNHEQGLRAILTRNTDEFIHLRRRLKLVRTLKADLFISIHADAYRYRDAEGVSVFALSLRGATSAASCWLARKENESEFGQAILDKSQELRSVLIDLAQTATISSSLEIGKLILGELSNIAVLHGKRVEQAGFMILKSPDIPSLLVEIGFVSSSREEQRLRLAEYQEKLASKIADGIKAYFMRRPPRGSYWSQVKLNSEDRLDSAISQNF